MNRIEAKLKQCRLAAVPAHVQQRVIMGAPGRDRPRVRRWFWSGIAASVLFVCVANWWIDRAYDLSPYGAAVASSKAPRRPELTQFEAEVAALLGDAADGYLAYLRGETNGG